MALWLEAHWDAVAGSGLSRADRRDGRYRQYLPDFLIERPLKVGPRLSAKAADVERAVRTMGGCSRGPRA